MRLLNLGTVPWIESQSVHHAVARVFDSDTPDTFLIVRPDRPYICIGRHAIGVPISRVAAARLGFPIVRRQLGGGPVLITPDQTFFILVADQTRLPLPDRAAFTWALTAGAAAYRQLGVDAHVGPGTDLTAAGRKVCGSGAASFGRAAVVGGNVIHDFDPAQFVDLVEAPSAAVRTALLGEMQGQMGSVRLLTGRIPAAADVAGALVRGAEEAYGARLVPGSLTGAERAALPATEQWLRRVAEAPERPHAPYWKVRSGFGVLRLALDRPPAVSLIVRVRDSRIASVAAEEAGGAALAAAVNAVLSGRHVDELRAGDLSGAAGVPDDVAAEVQGGLRHLHRWVT